MPIDELLLDIISQSEIKKKNKTLKKVIKDSRTTKVNPCENISLPSSDCTSSASTFSTSTHCASLDEASKLRKGRPC